MLCKGQTPLFECEKGGSLSDEDSRVPGERDTAEVRCSGAGGRDGNHARRGRYGGQGAVQRRQRRGGGEGADSCGRTRQGRRGEGRPYARGCGGAGQGHPGHAAGDASDRPCGTEGPAAADRGRFGDRSRAVPGAGAGPGVGEDRVHGLAVGRHGDRGGRARDAGADLQGVHRPGGGIATVSGT